MPSAYHAEAPAFWSVALASDPNSFLEPEVCVIGAEHFFIRGLIEVPVVDSDDVFAWGVWVSLSKDSFDKALASWETPGREADPPAFGWLSTELGLYSPSTLNLKTNVHSRPVGERPVVELEPTDHPLAVEQRKGITVERVRQIAEAILHPGQ